MQISNRLMIVDGELQMIDGSSVKEYLREYQEECGIADGTAMSLLTYDRAKSIEMTLEYMLAK